MDNQFLKAMIDQADLRDDFMRMTDIAYNEQPRCGIACAPGCFIMSPAST
jgi:hypothetical protein